MISIVVVGSGGSGKTTLCVRYVNGMWVERYDPTIEDTYRKQVELDGQAQMVEIIDTAGQEQYEETTQMSLALASCVMVAVASDSAESLRRASAFIELARQARNTPSLHTSATHPPIMVVRTKSDVSSCWSVTDEQIIELCRRYDLPSTNFLVTSARLNRGVNEAFETAIRAAQAYVERAYALESVRQPRRNSVTSSLLNAASALRLSSSSSSNVTSPATSPSISPSSVDSAESASTSSRHRRRRQHQQQRHQPPIASESTLEDGGSGGSGGCILV